MKPFDFAQVLAQAAAGSEVHVMAGEFEGPWVIERPIRLVGDGPATVLWAHQGPVLTIRAPGVHLQSLALEVTDEEEGVALLIDQQAASRPPQFLKVRLLGKAEGLGQNQRWRVPAVIDLGRISPRHGIQKTVGLEAPRPVTVHPELTGLTAAVQELSGDRQALQLTLDGTGLIAGYLLEGRVEVEANGLITIVRVNGQIVAEEEQPQLSSADLIKKPSAALDMLSQDGQSRNMSVRKSREQKPEASMIAPVHSTGGNGGLDRLKQTAQPPTNVGDELSWVETLLQTAQAAMKANDPDKAIELLSQAVKLKPDQVELHAELAALYGRQGHFDSAAREWQRVLTLDPQHGEVYQELVHCYNQLNRFEDSIELLERLLRDPARQNDALLYRSLAIAYYKVNRHAEALWALERAQQVRFDPKLVALQNAWRHGS